VLLLRISALTLSFHYFSFILIRKLRLRSTRIYVYVIIFFNFQVRKIYFRSALESA